MNSLKTMPTLRSTIGTLAASLAIAITSSAQQNVAKPSPAPKTNIVETLRSAVKSGDFSYRLTTPEELKARVGAPTNERTEKDGDSNLQIFEYPQAQAVFAHFGETPYTLVHLSLEGVPQDIGKDKLVTLRSTEDLAKLDPFWGVANVSLVRLDLTGQLRRLNQLPFDSRTRWPGAEKLPSGFDPAKLLEDGKNPGLGLRKLHEQGIDGRGIHIAIIDQPLLRNHREYKDRVVEYHEIDVEGAPVQMHGSPVTSIAVGQTCGTAPAASVHYYATPMWKWWQEHCKPYAATLEQIIEHNKELSAAQKVRVVSISLGAFSQWSDHDLWSNAVRHAAAEGILVVSCDPAYGQLAMLKRKPGPDADSPDQYVNQFWFNDKNTLSVPAGNRTTASYSGPDDYVFWRDGGMSWTVPYLAGVAALAFQVNPQLNPADIPELWRKTATKTSAGLVLNPPGFLDAVRQAKPIAPPQT